VQVRCGVPRMLVVPAGPVLAWRVVARFLGCQGGDRVRAAARRKGPFGSEPL